MRDIHEQVTLPVMPRVLDGMQVVDLADFVLLSIVRRGAASLIVEPSADGYRAVADELTSTEASMTVGREVGDGLVARIAILAGIDVTDPQSRIGKLTIVAAESSVRPGETTVELMVVARVAEEGLALEVRRLATADEAIIIDEAAPLLKGALAKDRPSLTDFSRASPYSIVREIGRGGMGVVYLAVHKLLEKQVALKVLHTDVAANPAVAASLVREGRAASRARHPGILDVTDFGVLPDGRPYLVTEFVEAETLQDALAKGPLAPWRAARLTQQIAEALHVVHESGVVHGDIKPGNVFVFPDDRIKIADFGAAQVAPVGGASEASVERETAFTLTPGYSAPEVTRGAVPDRRFDVYALGCVLFHALVGHVPFRSATVLGTMRMHVSMPVPPLPAPVPLPLARIVMRALQKDPAARYQTALEMAEDLGQARVDSQSLSSHGPLAGTPNSPPLAPSEPGEES